MTREATKEKMTSVYGLLGGVIAKLRDSVDEIERTPSKLMAREERILVDGLENTKNSLIMQRVELGKFEVFDPISEEDALAEVRSFANGINDEYRKLVNLFCSDFEDNPIHALSNEAAISALVRLHFCVDIFEKIGLYNEELVWSDVLHRVESSIQWNIKQMCSSPNSINPMNVFEMITWRIVRQSILELTYIMGLADRVPNPVIDLYEMVIALTIGVEKKNDGLKGA